MNERGELAKEDERSGAQTVLRVDNGCNGEEWRKRVDESLESSLVRRSRWRVDRNDEQSDRRERFG